MAKINFSPAAINDLKEIKSYITDDLCSEQAAVNLIKKIMMRIRQLEDFPEIGAHLSSIVKNPFGFLGFFKIATITSSNNSLACFIMFSCPFVMGSKLPVYNTFVIK